MKIVYLFRCNTMFKCGNQVFHLNDTFVGSLDTKNESSSSIVKKIPRNKEDR